MLFHEYFATRGTPQSMPIPGAGQSVNSAGGYAWLVDDWTRLDRFLVLGTEGGTYYIGERKLTVENALAVKRCIEQDGVRVVARIVQVSLAGRAPKNDPALYALAMATGVGDTATRQAALAALPAVARTGTHLFHFLAYAEAFRGWGRGLRRAVAGWYNALPAEQLAYQALKYQQRDGWSHRDALRLAHPKAVTAQHDAIYHWVTQGWPDVGPEPHPDPALRLIWAYEQAKRAATVDEVVARIDAYALPWEAVPGAWLGESQVWKTLLPRLPLTATLRNLARMTANGALAAGEPEVALVTERLTDPERLRKARVHPIAVLSTLKTYAQGKGERGKLNWAPIPAVIDALDQAFYLAFQQVEPTGKRLVLALDVSGSMDSGRIAGVPGLTPKVAAAAMALVTAQVEPQHTLVAFTAGGEHSYASRWGMTGLARLSFGSGQRLDEVIAYVNQLPFGGTDCALPMLWALGQGVEADAFVIYTDSETWAGAVHPVEALREYRRKTGIPARLVVVGMTSNGFSIADPQDAGMLDVVGFDSATPQLISDFIRG